MNNTTDDYFLQVSYAKILGSQLERFRLKRDSPFLAVARCPICLEGTSKTKTRFFIYEKAKSLNCTCFNCNLSTTLPNFLRLNYTSLFNEFKFDKFRINDTGPVITTSKINFTPVKTVIKSNSGFDIPLVSELPRAHPARKYIESRKLPDYPFYYSDKFYNFSSQYNDEFKSSKKDEPRIIIPFFDRKRNIFAYQGRDLSGHAKQKYITVKINQDIPLLFGFAELDISKPMILVEGPLDSLFVPNGIASINASLAATAKWLLAGINKSPASLTLVLDNEPRSKAVVREYEKAIDSGFKLVIWPKSVELKDINAMVLAGLDPVSIIKKNTFQGLEAKINFNNWKKM